MDIGKCSTGHMQTKGWDDVRDKFKTATGKVHSSDQFGSRYRELKKMWTFIEDLRTSTGLGRRADGSVVAEDWWWEAKIKEKNGKQEWHQLKQGWPPYLPEMDRMYKNVAVTGITARVPGVPPVARELNFVDIDSEEEGDDEGDDEGGDAAEHGHGHDSVTPESRASPLLDSMSPPCRATPVSSASKRTGGSTQSTAGTPTKKRKNAAAKKIDKGMTQFTASYNGRTNVIQELLLQQNAEAQEATKRKEEAAQRKEAAKAARKKSKNEVIAAAQQEEAHQDEHLWGGVLKILENDDLIETFLMTPSGAPRRAMIKRYADMPISETVHLHNNASMDTNDSDDSAGSEDYEAQSQAGWQQLLAFAREDEEDVRFIIGMYDTAQHVDKYCSRRPYRMPALSGLQWVENKLADETSCFNMFRMSPHMFLSLHDLLTSSYGLKSSSKSTSIEALALFLWMCGAPQSVRQAEDRFERSLGTVHNLFHKVLQSVVKLAGDNIVPSDPNFTTIHRSLLHDRFYPEFKDCIGAIDGTHIPVVVPGDNLIQHMCRKNKTTQNVMAVCDFDMCFTFVLAGWPGSVHDMTVLRDAMSRFREKFPMPPRGKYYLVDSGYANRTGFLTPYRQTMYHIQEFQNAAGQPRGMKETFNYAHSSLRNVIERAFGVLKMKWRILLAIPAYHQEAQTNIIMACMALHNFIRKQGGFDPDFVVVENNQNYVPTEAGFNQPSTSAAPEGHDLARMNAFRDELALSLYTRYNS